MAHVMATRYGNTVGAVTPIHWVYNVDLLGVDLLGVNLLGVDLSHSCSNFYMCIGQFFCAHFEMTRLSYALLPFFVTWFFGCISKNWCNDIYVFTLCGVS